MKLAFLDKQNALYFFPFDEQEKSSLTIPAIEGGRYIFTEQQNALRGEAVTAQRLDNDLNLRLYTDPQKPFDIVLKDFFLGDNGIYSLTSSGEYNQHLVARSDVAQGAVEWISTSLGRQQDQDESEFLTAIQRAATFEAIEQQLAVLNADVVAPVEADAPLVGPRLMSASAFTVYPEITAIYDNAGSTTGSIQLNTQQGIAIIDDRLPVFEGSGEPNSTLEILHGGEPILTVKVDAQGHWSIQLEDTLGEGAQFFSVRDVATGQVSDSVVLIIDTIAPQRATITQVIQDHTGTASAVSNGGYTADNTPTLTGKAEASSLITIYNGDVELGATIANAQGVWRFTRANPPLPDGEYGFKVLAQDASGNVSLPSKVYKVIIDTMAPEQPQIVEVLDDVGSATGPLLHGAITDDTAPTLKGKAEAHSTVKIFDRDSQIASVTADVDGNWTFTPEQPLAEGAHSFTVTATDRAGHVSEPSAPLDLTVMLGLPSMPIITAVKDDVGSIQGILEKNASTDDTRPTIEGTAAALSTITIYSNGTLLGTVEADAEGHWSFTPQAALANGLHNLTAIATNAAGSASEPTAIYPITVDSVATKPHIDAGRDIDGNIFNSGAFIDELSPRIAIAGEYENTVVIYDKGIEIARGTIDTKLWWGNAGVTYITLPLTEGFHDLTVIAIDAAGNVSQPSFPFTFTIVTAVPAAPVITEVKDDVGSIQGGLGKNAVTDDARPTIEGTAAARSTISIYSNGTLLDTVEADAEGHWSFTPQAALANGLHQLTAISTNKAGTSSASSEAYSITLDTVVNKPTIDSVFDDQGAQQRQLIAGAVTDDANPVISGKAESASTVVIFDKGVEIGRVTADTSGNWTFIPGVVLADGVHDLTVKAIDLAGNTSAVSSTFSFSVDTSTAMVSITSVMDDVGSKTGAISKGGVTDDNKPTLVGKATINGIVKVYDGTMLLGQTTADASGNWSFTPASALSDGLHNLKATVTTLAAGESAPTAVFDLTVNTAVATVSITSVSDDVGSKTGAISKGGVTDDNKPTLVGKATINGIVKVYDGTMLLGQTTADASGNWSFTPASALSDGLHNLKATVTTLAAGESAPTAVFDLTVDTAVATVSITYLNDTSGAITGPVFNGGVTDAHRGLFVGKATPNGIVKLYSGGTLLGQTTANASGDWTFQPLTVLSNTTHKLTATVTTLAGQIAKSAVFELTVDAFFYSSSITAVTDDVGSKTGAISNGGVTDDNRPTLKGKASYHPEGIIKIYDGATLLGSTKPDTSGNWSFTPESALSNGLHTLRVTNTTPAQGEREGYGAPEFKLTVNAPVAAPMSITLVTDDVGKAVQHASRIALAKDDVDSAQNNLDKQVEVLRGMDKAQSLEIEQPEAEVKSNVANALSISGADGHSLTLSLNDVLVSGQVDLLQGGELDIVQVADNASEVDAVKAESLKGMESFEENMSREGGVLASEGEVLALYQPSGLDTELLVQQGV